MDNESETLSSYSVESTDDDEPALDLDINVLQQLASSRLNRHCIRTRRLTRGLYNEIYLLQFDTGPDCIARLSRDLTHPATKFASEVATIIYVAQNTNIKVPKVYAWNCTVQNPIKIPYIIMERLPGQHLYRIWDDLTFEKKTCVLSQIVDTLLDLWTKCRFEEIGCLYMSYDSITPSSTFRIGPIVNSLFYTEGRDSIPSSTGPFESLQEFFSALIQKEKKFFEIHGMQELLEKKINQRSAEIRVADLIKQLDLLQSKLPNIFDESMDQEPFILVHSDFDAQNILVDCSPVNDDIKIVGIIDWEFSRTGTLWNLCQYPIWIQRMDEPFISSNAELQENRERQKLRDFFYDEMVAKLGNRSGQILKMKELDKRINDLEDMFIFKIHKFESLESLLKLFFYRYGSEAKANNKLFDPIVQLFWSPNLIKVQIPSEKTIDYFLSTDKLSDRTKAKVPIYYIASVYCELKSKGYNFSWQQVSDIAFHMWKNESKEKFG
ncbi:kinase-like domain-containing protein [Glomus cerebriforme]|uniref:Kinase-like domain-containing protein n=1 Tax=Glomus cerebriforme TaxID=658196 RepID=A0A397T441_9GLOM|nr:kinase-like domain-containing protein [Glomus cerebriforme]